MDTTKPDGSTYGPKEYCERMQRSIYEQALSEAQEKGLADLMLVLAGYIPDKHGGFKNPIRSKRLAASFLRKSAD